MYADVCMVVDSRSILKSPHKINSVLVYFNWPKSLSRSSIKVVREAFGGLNITQKVLYDPSILAVMAECSTLESVTTSVNTMFSFT